MTNVPLSFLPGVCKSNSAYADSVQAGALQGREAVGRFTDMDGARFVAGLPEKMGGNALAYTSALTGIPRGARDWRDNSGNIYLGIGTNKKLYAMIALTELDITPWRAIVTGTLTNKLSTTMGSATVNVNHTSHGLQTNDYVQLTASVTVGGLTIAGTYYVTRLDDDNYTIQAIEVAPSTESNGGGSIAYIYYRKVLTNPFDTVIGSPVVTVHHNNHGAIAGDFVTFSSAATVGGLTINGEYTIVTVATNTYTINAGSNASSTVSGGGGTPSVEYDISIGNADSVGLYGYGIGLYGMGAYSAASPIAATSPARTWCLQKYGQQLFANPYGGTIYWWDPTISGRAAPLYGAPATMLGMFITPERFVIALGINGIPMELAWPDQNDPTDWISTPENTANEGRTLQEGAYLFNGLSIRNGVSLIFSNTAAYNFDYSGDNNVYLSTLAGTKCGLVGPLACCELAEIAYWMGTADFWRWDGSVQALPSDDIRDYVFRDINLSQAQKFVAGSNVAKREIWFSYCSANSTEIDRYVIYHIDQGCWSIGTVFNITSWLDRGLLTYPVSTDPDGFIYNQESGVDLAGSAMESYIEFSPIDIAKGDLRQDIFSFIPDFKRQTGNVSLDVLTQNYPQDTATDDGPYAIADDGSTPIIDLRSSGKLVGYKLTSDVVGGDWRLGLPRVEIQPAGARR